MSIAFDFVQLEKLQASTGNVEEPYSNDAFKDQLQGPTQCLELKPLASGFFALRRDESLEDIEITEALLSWR
ncbi:MULTISPECIES: hypothetical protein [unclassified Lentimonas]|uniref:hypothetical protein n=1 Tax=unclassified Lentimonas TaxID=2630993 RepID=UPI00132354CC|nr:MULTISPECIES: hypothetical protein [unclassified Lentimonas]CAA6680059.1 Unannotated [Lentimonas sp. CC4]CAA6685179.1 Unannotated [Lentimonas sp. CC6]CAA7075095.1 Unannotated [Lentimonas sp. CC4]CAA7168445.1 Unannotated [Lentimonas sp. CC21]CAA7182120.1 Unannotated [Lentimonas sp. CC8]